MSKPLRKSVIALPVEGDKGSRAATEVVERPVRREYTVAYKLKVLEEIDAAKPGEIGAILRREGLYSSHLCTWRRQRDCGELGGSTGAKRGRKALHNRNLEKLQRKLERTELELRQAKLIIEAQKKLCQVLETNNTEDNE